MIDEIIEIILEVIFEFGTDKSTPKWIRYPLLAILIILATIAIFGILIFGFYILPKYTILGILFIVIGSTMLLLAIKKLRILITEKKKDTKKTKNKE